MKKANSPFSKTAVVLLTAALLLSGALVSCEKTAPITPAPSEPGVTDTASAPSSDEAAPEEEEPAAVEKKPDGSVDSDADSIEGITIRSAAELMKIGSSAKYPIDGDYVLVADIDLSATPNFTPIGGSESECGIVEGKNVFSGTFDGRGHTIIGLKISVSDTDRVHVGLFGSVGSKNKNDPAVVKNLILKDVNVSGKAKGTATYGVLCGQVSGHAVVDNISIISGTLNVENDSGDILGVGALIGQCRTKQETGCNNTTIHISNIFANVDVTGDNNGNGDNNGGTEAIDDNDTPKTDGSGTETIDDNDTPKTDGDEADDGSDTMPSMLPIILIILAIIAAFLLLLFSRRKRDDEQ
jgi:hypothetical protein